MIEDCKAGKIDLIVTKTVARFARNVLDCIGHVRMLAALSPPIGIFFETENLYTLDGRSEMALSFMATLAEEESRNKSEIMNASIEMRFKRGIFLTPPLLGYDNDEDGNLVINDDESKTVRLAFFMYFIWLYLPADCGNFYKTQAYDQKEKHIMVARFYFTDSTKRKALWGCTCQENMDTKFSGS